MEIWKPCPGYEELYSVSDQGRVKCHPKQHGAYFKDTRLLKQHKNKCGYHRVTFSVDSIKRNFYVHRLVALTFIPNPNNYAEVNHEDKNRSNNAVSNLSWVSRLMNLEHRDYGFKSLPIDFF